MKTDDAALSGCLAGGPPQGYEFFRKKLRDRTGIDLTAYKDRQMIRRLSSYLKRVDAPNFFVLGRRIERDDRALEELKDFLTINVSEFFRNPERYRVLEKDVLPELHGRFGRLTLWSAGCSIGAEPYSLSILLEEMDRKGGHRVIATDIDQAALKAAQAGVFRSDKLREVSEERLGLHFEAAGPDSWRVRTPIKRRVEFRSHDLLRDPYPKKVHLILCRNVVIYFTDQAKSRIYGRFAEALAPGGYLLIGGTESIFRPEQYGLRTAGPFLYQRCEE